MQKIDKLLSSFESAVIKAYSTEDSEACFSAIFKAQTKGEEIKKVLSEMNPESDVAKDCRKRLDNGLSAINALFD